MFFFLFMLLLLTTILFLNLGIYRWYFCKINFQFMFILFLLLATMCMLCYHTFIVAAFSYFLVDLCSWILHRFHDQKLHNSFCVFHDHSFLVGINRHNIAVLIRMNTKHIITRTALGWFLFRFLEASLLYESSLSLIPWQWSPKKQ